MLKKYVKYLIKYFFYLLTTIINKCVLYRNINKIIKSLPVNTNTNRQDEDRYIKLWSKLGSKPSIKWLRVYTSISGINDYRYISEIEYYHKVELVLNNKAFSCAYSDKNNYHNVFDHSLLPRVYIRNIEGTYYTEKYETITNDEELTKFIPEREDKLVVKNSVDTGGGRSIQIFTKKGNEFLNKNGDLLHSSFLSNNYDKNFMFQQYIYQHPFYGQFNDSSLNTIRLFTYRSVKDNQVIPLQAILRIGSKHSTTDNLQSGGVACGINSEGRLNSFAVNKKGVKFKEFNGISFNEMEPLYRFNDIVVIGLQLAKKLSYHRIVGFDFCLDKNEQVKLIEINLDDIGINGIQMNNGPLFNNFTDEIIDYCLLNKKTINITFAV